MKSAAVQLNILSDGDRTVIEAAYHSYLFPSVVAKSSSGREPGDKSDERIGEALAAARVLRSLAARLERQATGAIRHAETNRQHKEEIARREILKKLAEGPTPWHERKGFPPGTFAVAKSMDRRG